MATKIVKKYEELRKLQNSLKNAGACDSEPDGHFEAVVKRALKKEPVDFERGLEFGWELYSTSKKATILRFHNALKAFYKYAVKIHDKITIGELDEIKGDLWRVEWDYFPSEADRRY